MRAPSSFRAPARALTHLLRASRVRVRSDGDEAPVPACLHSHRMFESDNVNTGTSTRLDAVWIRAARANASGSELRERSITTPVTAEVRNAAPCTSASQRWARCALRGRSLGGSRSSKLYAAIAAAPE